MQFKYFFNFSKYTYNINSRLFFAIFCNRKKPLVICVVSLMHDYMVEVKPIIFHGRFGWLTFSKIILGKRTVSPQLHTNPDNPVFIFQSKSSHKMFFCIYVKTNAKRETSVCKSGGKMEMQKWNVNDNRNDDASGVLLSLSLLMMIVRRTTRQGKQTNKRANSILNVRHMYFY